MLIIPAIDLLDGKCVRLYKGDYDKVTVYGENPLEVALSLEEAGAKRIHLVDLDAARGKGKNNRNIISKIRKNTKALLELGGGIRGEEDIKEIIDTGIDRLILGTVFAKNPEKCALWIDRFGKKFIAGIDALDGKVKVSGWESDSGVIDTELARQAGKLGFCSIIYTNISRDGTLEGPDTERTIKIAKEAGIPVIVSGGIRGDEDFKAITENLEANGKIAGIITGKALYAKTFDLALSIKNYQKDEKLFF